MENVGVHAGPQSSTRLLQTLNCGEQVAVIGRADAITRPLLHAHYSGGATKEESKELRHEWRQVYQNTKAGNILSTRVKS
jgi:hypothetical protein